MIKIAASLGLGALLLTAAPALACPSPIVRRRRSDAGALRRLDDSRRCRRRRRRPLRDHHRRRRGRRRPRGRLPRRGAGHGAGDARLDAVARLGPDRAAHRRPRRRRPGAPRLGAPPARHDRAGAPPRAGGRRPQPLVAGGPAARADARRARDPAVAGAAHGLGRRRAGAVDAVRPPPPRRSACAGP